MKRRLLLGVLGTLFEEAAILAVAIWGLPLLGVRIPSWGLILVMVGWAGYSTFTHWLGNRAMKRDHVIGLPHMIGTRGEVVSRLAPEGMVRIKGELWIARAEAGVIPEGKAVVVTAQERLKLIVREEDHV